MQPQHVWSTPGGNCCCMLSFSQIPLFVTSLVVSSRHPLVSGGDASGFNAPPMQIQVNERLSGQLRVRCKVPRGAEVGVEWWATHTQHSSRRLEFALPSHQCFPKPNQVVFVHNLKQSGVPC